MNAGDAKVNARQFRADTEHGNGDDVLTIIAIGILAAIQSNILHEGFGHGLTALLSGAQSGVVSTVAWNSAFDSHLVQAGGTLINLVAGFLFWIAMRSRNANSPCLRYFLAMACAFNLFTGTGYFLFSGVSNFGDWADVIAGRSHHGLWRLLLVVVGASSYFTTVRLVGSNLVRYVGVERSDSRRMRKLLWVPYFSAVALASAAATLNPSGIKLLWLSALPATMGGLSGLLWLQYYIPGGTAPQQTSQPIARNLRWMGAALVVATGYVAIIGPGLTLHR